MLAKSTIAESDSMTITVANPIVEKYLDLVDADFRTVSRAAGKELRRLGYTRRYSHAAWNRGYRWFAPNSDQPLAETCPAHILGEILSSRKTGER
jgi:hypothetical protein